MKSIWFIWRLPASLDSPHSSWQYCQVGRNTFSTYIWVSLWSWQFFEDGLFVFCGPWNAKRVNISISFRETPVLFGSDCIFFVLPRKTSVSFWFEKFSLTYNITTSFIQKEMSLLVLLSNIWKCLNVCVLIF